MAQPKVARSQGQVVAKHIDEHFTVEYQCGCKGESNLLTFKGEEKQTCRACKQQYQLRVMVGRVEKNK